MVPGWVASMPAAYDEGLGPTLFAPFAADLAARAADRSPTRILEVAAGTGILTRALVDALPGAEVVATDLSEAMVALGRERVPDVTWRMADALALPFDDGEFDLVAWQFGVMFLPDRPAGFVEAARVLRPGGTLLCSTWGRVQEHHFATALQAALGQVRPDDPPSFVVTLAHGYADVDVVRADVTAGGFHDVVVHTVTLDGTAPSGATVAHGFCAGTPLAAQLTPAEAEAVTAAMVEDLGPGPVTGPMTAYVVEAVR